MRGVQFELIEFAVGKTRRRQRQAGLLRAKLGFISLPVSLQKLVTGVRVGVRLLQVSRLLRQRCRDGLIDGLLLPAGAQPAFERRARRDLGQPG